YYRLNVLPIRVPPLRERRADIPALVEVLAEDMALRSGSAPPELDADAMALLAAQNWRGNIRELRNVMEQAAMRSDSHRIEVRHLEEVLRESGVKHIAAPAVVTQDAARPTSPVLRPLAEQVAEIERQAIDAAMAATGGNKVAAAKLLGISRAKLYERLEALPDFRAVPGKKTIRVA
ncbi:MAG TPA: helix-turn-helix domain-containing protein, partial [Ramlibacter sp.]|nr:helix-turn-helix domain-containing protein [Ramlibacter sp.]